MSLMADWNARMEEARAKTEFAPVRPADIRVFAQLRGRSLKLSAIHREMGFSRQAAQQAVDRLVSHDMLRLAPDPESRRDKVVTITEKGQRWRTIAANQIRMIETQIARILGEDGREELRKMLVLLASEADR